MEKTNDKLRKLLTKIDNKQSIKVAIFGLGSVGNYLLNFLLDYSDKDMQIIVVGRDNKKLEQDLNIATVAASIRGTLKSKTYFKKLDFNNIDELTNFFQEEKPDFVVNSSRAYSGIKYGSISWHNIRAYGIWTPLSISIIKNIMIAHKESNSNAIVINTSYSDAVNAWLKSSDLNYPDFGSGNLNHLIPRIKFAVTKLLNLDYSEKVDVIISTSHFHDVVISKEGQTENINPLLKILVNDKEVDIDHNKIYKLCAISMPTDQKRNMMNASSNFEIITKILNALKYRKEEIFHSPGVFGNIGGFPIIINGENCSIKFYEQYFSLEEMKKHNLNSIYLDGIENIDNSFLIYTDELLKKVKDIFNVDLPKKVHFNDIENIAKLLIEKVIRANI
ncbi:saccharopine dehydrogenase NADP-binding domain-containing protein [Aliarcobacter butzleri]|uniref:saccharopine dehydrogenase NADP-binding domain-containing protein n=1 Tax=Aliarcobacter butzleri TaxID=28197 RepID=UPI003AF71072